MKNTDDDYLWDGTGKPDPEIQRLEEIIGTLRYQPRPLEIPAGVTTGRNRYFSRILAIAAGVALIALGLSVWMAMQKPSNPEFAGTKSGPTQSERAAAGPDEKKINDLRASQNVPEKKASHEDSADVDRVTTASNVRRHRPFKNSKVSTEEIAEARAAKDQLMLALRVTSSKLNLAQRKTVGSAVHNQHKIG